jgi:hypothetical protein
LTSAIVWLAITPVTRAASSRLQILAFCRQWNPRWIRGILAGADAAAQSDVSAEGTIDEMLADGTLHPECSKIFKIDKSAHHRSLQVNRFHKASHALITSGYIGSSPEIQPTINTHRPRLGSDLVQPIFRSPSRRSPLLCSPGFSRRIVDLKMLCGMYHEI